MKTWPVVGVSDELDAAVRAKLKTGQTLADAVRLQMARWVKQPELSEVRKRGRPPKPTEEE